MLLSEFYVVVSKRQQTNKYERYGQALFNALDQIRPDLAARIVATDLDPFYRSDSKGMDSALANWLWENW